MKKITFIVIIGLLICSCSSSSTNSNEDASNGEATSEETATNEEAKVSSSATVLNPNLASRDEIYSLGLLDTDIELIINGRPYLDPMAFLSKMKEVVGESKITQFLNAIALRVQLLGG
ncbi:MAG: hypothetical protein AAF600_01810 [Bacteroidota bacterium]